LHPVPKDTRQRLLGLDDRGTIGTETEQQVRAKGQPDTESYSAGRFHFKKKVMIGKKVLIACECSQVVCSAFRKHGFEAYSCDIEKCYGGHKEWHILGDAVPVIYTGYGRLENGSSVCVKNWDLLIAHPPCTNLTHASAPALASGLHSMEDVRSGAEFFMKMLNSPVDKIAVENPAPLSVAKLPRYNQIIDPTDYGHAYAKRICLWLKNLPMLLPTRAKCIDSVSWHDRWSGGSKMRSRFFEGVAEAMAEQWGGIL